MREVFQRRFNAHLSATVSQATGLARPMTKAANRLVANPYAERITPEVFRRLVRDFYGTKTLVIDPEMAEAILAYNTANRRVNRRKLAILVAQMDSGEFENTGEPIILSAEGVLNDGQHRLLAVVESGATVDMDVRFGIPRRAFT